VKVAKEREGDMKGERKAHEARGTKYSTKETALFNHDYQARVHPLLQPVAVFIVLSVRK